MSIKECAEKYCKECLTRIPEKDREAIIQNLGKLGQVFEKGLPTFCHCLGNLNNMKEK
jgi:hypothetical protein